jgi:hypothetical protein
LAAPVRSRLSKTLPESMRRKQPGGELASVILPPYDFPTAVAAASHTGSSPIWEYPAAQVAVLTAFVA